jgi:3-(3-hydroxy-phenyl)propionate hydroxylase
LPRHLVTEPNLAAPDDFYAALAELHRGLSVEESAKANAKLILLLANHIGDAAVLDEALALARPKATGTPAS